MAWLGALLFKFGMGRFVPMLVPILIGLLLGGGSLTAWLGDWTDWKTAILVFVLLAATIWLVSVILGSASQIVRIACAFAIAVLWTFSGYYKGRIDEALLTDEKVLSAEIAVHKQYKAAFKAETERQAEVAKAADEAAKKASDDWFEERKRLRAEVQRAREEASKSANAKRPALGVDAIDRINRLRHDPRATAVPSGGGETQAR